MRNLFKAAIAVTTAISAIALSTPAKASIWPLNCGTRDLLIAQSGRSVMCFADEQTQSIDDDNFYLLTEHYDETSVVMIANDAQGGMTIRVSELGNLDGWTVYLRDDINPLQMGDEYYRIRYQSDIETLLTAMDEISVTGLTNSISLH